MSRMTAQRRRSGKPTWFEQNEARVAQILRDLTDARKRRTILAAGVEGIDPAALDEAAALLSRMKPTDRRRTLASPVGAGPLRLPTAGICTSYKGDLFDAVHEPADVYKIALYVSASTIGPSTTAYTATNEVANGGGYTTGGQNLAGRQVVIDGTTAILDWTTDPVWAAATITARGALIYNSSQSNKAMAVLDFGADIASTNGNFTVALPSPTAAAGAIRIG